MHVIGVYQCTYLWALKDFRHSHFLVLHTQIRPSSPPLSKWDGPWNSRHEMVPVKNKRVVKLLLENLEPNLLQCVTFCTVMIQQGSVFSFIAHVIELNSFVFASRGDEAVVGCHCRQWGCVSMVREVGFNSPLLK